VNLEQIRREYHEAAAEEQGDAKRKRR
jgi:hypothetical protein